MSTGGGARAVRLARESDGRAIRPVRTRARSETPAPPGPTERRPNRSATTRVRRLTLIYVVAVGAIYAVLATVAEASAAGGTTGVASDLLLEGLIALAFAAVGVVVTLGAAPRAVVLGPESTVVLGRFGGRYRFPPPERLQRTVLQRIAAGPLTPAPVEQVELSGGTSRRAFLIDEGLLEPAPGAAADRTD